MLKVKSSSKGFIVSPFFIVLLILLSITLIAYFSQSDLERAKSITIEGQINQAILDMEELNPVVQTLALFSSYQSAYEVGEKNGEKQDLEETIERYMNDYFKDYSSGEGVTAKGNFSIFVTENQEGNFLIKVNASPIFQINKSKIQMNSTLTFERSVDARFFLLYKLSREMNKSYLINSYTMEVMNQLLNKFDFTPFNYIIENETNVIINGSINNIVQANNGSFMEKIFENAIIDLEKDSKFLFFEIDNNSCAITFIPKLITVDGNKEYVDNTTIWNWGVSISLIAKIFDYSKFLDNETTDYGVFQINVSKPIILRNGTLTPLSYKIPEEKTMFFYQISTICNGIDDRDINRYTVNMFNNETHLPKYIFLLP